MQRFLNDKVTLHAGDCLDVIKTIPDASIDAVCTDPPYALVSIGKRYGGADAKPAKGDVYARAASGFMGKTWDTGEVAFSVEFWREVLRVLKPGGHVVAASGTRTYHRLACAIEDAGFEIRDMVSWLYGSGFPKSHDVSKGIDKAAGVAFEASPASGVGFMGPDGPGGYNVTKNQLKRSGESTDAARQWAGWGTALKPACEPWVLARKPLVGTVAGNVLEHGTGALNVDGCRVGNEERLNLSASSNEIYGQFKGAESEGRAAIGRWPANVIHDGSDEVVGAFPDSAGQQGAVGGQDPVTNVYGDFGPRPTALPRGDSGSAARFFASFPQEGASRLFYSSKADSEDRLGSRHPTIKPVALMQYLCRLITPPGGTVLDPFAGTGTTGEAAWREGFRCVLIEREAEYRADIERRMKLALGGPDERRHAIVKEKSKGKPVDHGPLFGWPEAAE